MPTYEYVRPHMYPQQLAAIFEPKDDSNKPARYSLIEASTKSGKTVGCMAWLLEQALIHGKENNNFWWVAPVTNQADIAFGRLCSGIPRSLTKINLTERRITLPNGAKLWFKGGDKPDSLYGEDVYAAVIDEASRLKEAAWHSVRSTLTATRGPVRIIGNVKGRKNWFYVLARRAKIGAPGMSYHKITADDAVGAGVLAKSEIDDARETLPPSVFRELYMAEASDNEGNPFGGSEIIELCHAPMSKREPVSFGIDLAKKRDFTAIIGLDEFGHVCVFHHFRKPWVETEKIAADIVGNVPTLMDSTGVGDPVLEHVQRDAVAGNVEGYNFSPLSKQRLMEGLALSIGKKEVHFPEGIISDELEQFEYQLYGTGRVRYAAPDGFYDDCVMALALAVQCRGLSANLRIWELLSA